jgi:hypothetical protein
MGLPFSFLFAFFAATLRSLRLKRLLNLPTAETAKIDPPKLPKSVLSERRHGQRNVVGFRPRPHSRLASVWWRRTD